MKLSDAEMKLAEAEAASESASASNTRPSTPSPVKGENDPDSVSSEVKLSINVDGGARELARDLLARAELSEAAVAELRAKLESANVRIATADEELRAARKTVEETAERADTSAQETETLKRRIETLDAALVEAKDEAESYRSGIAAAETKLAASTDESNANRQSLVQRVDAAEKDLAAALARCADMSERRDAAETRAVSAGAAADAAAAAAAENFTAKQTADRVAADLRQQMEDVKKGAEAEVDALGTQLEGALTELADARALAVGLNGFTLNPEGSESFPSEAATDGSADDLDKQPASPGTGSAPNELLEELVRRRVREAQLEADAAKLRVRLDAAESQARRTRAELEDSAVFKNAASNSPNSGAGSVGGAGSDSDSAALASSEQLAEYKAKCAHLRSMLDAKEEALEEVERRARSAAEAAASFAKAAAETPTRSPPVEKTTVGAEGAVQAMDDTAVEAAVQKRLAAVGSIIETWRRAVEAKELEIGALVAKITELEASTAEQTDSANGAAASSDKLAEAEREVHAAADKLAAALLASEDPAETARAGPISKTKKMPLGVATDAITARLAYLAKRAEVHESETRRLVDAEARVHATHEAAMAKADARLAELAHALKESAESEGRAQAAAAQASAAKTGAEQALEKCVDDLRAAEDRVRAITQRSDGAQERDQSGQAKALMLQAECSELRAKVEKRNREVRELNQMLKAWEAMRHSKDKQIAQLVERCRKFEEEAADKARAIDAMRSRLGRGGADNENGSVGSVSFNRTPNSARRSPTGTSMRLSPSPAPSSVSSFAFGTRAPSSSRSPENVKAEFAGDGKENPNPAALAYGSATKRFASTLGVKGSIDDEVRTRVGGAYVSVAGDVSPRGGVPSPKRALRTLGR